MRNFKFSFSRFKSMQSSRFKKTVQKYTWSQIVAFIFWVTTLLLMFTFVGLAVGLPHYQGKEIAQHLTTNQFYSNVLALTGGALVLCLFLALALTIIPRVPWGKKTKKDSR